MDRNDEWFEKLFEAWYPSLVRYFVQKGCTKEDARDLAQMTMMRVYRYRESFREESSEKTWIFRIAQSVLLNEVRRTKSRGGPHGTTYLSDLEGPEGEPMGDSQPAAAEPLADELLIRTEQEQNLRQAIEELPRQQRTCVRLRVLHEMKYKEIARVMGLSMETVKSALHDAKLSLKKVLGEGLPALRKLDEEDKKP